MSSAADDSRGDVCGEDGEMNEYGAAKKGGLISKAYMLRIESMFNICQVVIAKFELCPKFIGR